MADVTSRPVASFNADAGPIQGVVTDLDGTALDTEPLYYDAYAAMAAAHGKAYNFQEFHRHILGRAEHHGAQILVDLLELDISADQLLEERDKHFLALLPSVRLLPGAMKAMHGLKAAGLRLAVATSSCRSYISAKQSPHPEFFALFDQIVCGDDEHVKGHSKPEPHIFLHAASTIGVTPRQCVAFEDSLAGIRSAKAAGMFTVAIPDARLDPADVAAAGPDITLNSFEEFDLSMIGLSSSDGTGKAAADSTGGEAKAASE